MTWYLNALTTLCFFKPYIALYVSSAEATSGRLSLLKMRQ